MLSWPCFALHDAQQNKAAIKEIIETLKGRHGFKRFLRDGYGTAMEDKNRLYYNASEIKVISATSLMYFSRFTLIVSWLHQYGDKQCYTTKKYIG